MLALAGSIVVIRRAVENLLPSKSDKIKSRWAILEMTLSLFLDMVIRDKNRMRQSAPVRVGAVSTGRLLSLPGSKIITEHASPLHFLRLLRVCDQEKSDMSGAIVKRAAAA